jgi:hypothetical protein
MKKDRNSREIRELYYKNEDGSYEKAGVEFSGFPANGLWLVIDGSQSLIEYKGEIPKPFTYKDWSRFVMNREECMSYVTDKINLKNSYSIKDIVDYSTDYFFEKFAVECNI